MPESNMQQIRDQLHDIKFSEVNFYMRKSVLSSFSRALAVMNFIVDKISPRFDAKFMLLPVLSFSPCSSTKMVSPVMKCSSTKELLETMNPL